MEWKTSAPFLDDEEEATPTISFDAPLPVPDLPDLPLIKTFVSCNPKDVAIFGEVNRQWYRASRDKSLWRRVDMTEQKISIKQLHKFVRGPLARHLLALRIEGELHRPNTGQRRAVTPAFLQLLSQTCVHIRELHIVNADIINVTLRPFPRTLTFLGLRNSQVGFNFFEDLNDPDVLPELRGLDLTQCHNLCSRSHSVPAILSRHQLTHLNLSNCFKVSGDHFCRIPSSLPQLAVLCVSECRPQVNDAFLRHVADQCANLKELDVSFCGVSDLGVAHLANSPVCKLEKLLLIETRVSNLAIAELQRMKSLKSLSLIKTSCSEQRVLELRAALPDCNVQFHFTDSDARIGNPLWFVPIQQQQQPDDAAE